MAQQRGTNRSKFLSTSAFMTAGMLVFAAGTAWADASNPWADVSAVTGSLTKDLSVINQNTITQHSDRTVATAGSGDILSNQTVKINQNNSGSLFVLKTTGADQDGSQIEGALRANGRVMVLDRNGVFFGAGSQIDVGGIVASTGDVDNDAVMRGDTKLELSNFGDASVINSGRISVTGAGLAALVAPHVVNNGVIEAKLGKVALAAGGERATVDLYGDGLVELIVGGKTGKALAENNGTIEGTTVLMTSAGAKDVVDTVINMNGVIKASSVSVQGGKIILNGGSAGKVKVSGTLDVSGENAGTINVSGYDIDVTEAGLFMADGGETGNGGTSILFADNLAIVNGRFSARGGRLGGNGGFIETSGLELGVGDSTIIDASATNGEAGLWLLDPLSILIASGSNGTMSYDDGNGVKNWQRVSVSAINAALDNNNVTVQTGANGPYGSSSTNGSSNHNEGDIIVLDSILKDGGTGNTTLALNAHDDIFVNNTISATGAGRSLSVALNAGFTDGAGTNNDNDIFINAAITTNGGSATFTADSDIYVNAAVTTGAGNITATAGDDIIMGGTGGQGVQGTQGGDGGDGGDATAGSAAQPEHWTKGNSTTYTNPAAGWVEYIGTYWTKNGNNFFVNPPSGSVSHPNSTIWKTGNGMGTQYRLTDPAAGWMHHAYVPATPGSNGVDGGNGANGNAGNAGAAGSNGSLTTTTGNILLTADAITLGGNGGIGGNGGKGGRGGDAGEGAGFPGGTDYRGGDGGIGGQGGQGGNGGNGGNGSLASGTGNITLAANEINFTGSNGAGNNNGSGGTPGSWASNNGGLAGQAGMGGNGGAAGVGGTGGTGSITTGGTVSIDRKSDGDISVGDNNGGLNLSQSDLAKISAGTLNIGGGNTEKLEIEDADFTGFNLTVLNTKRGDSTDDEDVFFYGNNKSKALTVNADDDIELRDDATLDAQGNVTFNANTNNMNDGDFRMHEDSRITMNGFDLKSDALKTILEDDAVIDAEGGDINLHNDQTFFADDAESIRTSGNGTITLNQNAGGSIQNAIDALKNTGNTGFDQNRVFVGNGAFGGGLQLNHNNLSLYGTGYTNTTTINVTGTNPGMTVMADNVVVEGFKFQGVSNSNSGIIINPLTDNIIIRENGFYSLHAGVQQGINANPTSNVDILDNQFGGASAGSKVTYGILKAGGPGAANDWEIAGNEFNALTAGVEMSYLGGTTSIHNNVFNGGTYGIKLGLATGTTSINTNTMNGAGTGIRASGIDGLSVGGNTISNGGAGVYANNSLGLNIGGNTITTMTGNGIETAGTSSGSVSSNTIAGADGNGIRIGSGGLFNVNSNTITDSGANGILANNLSAGSIINSNTINGTGSNGIAVGNSASVVITGNGVKNAGGNGISVSDSDFAQVLSNLITDAGTNGIYNNSSDSTLVGSNVILSAGLSAVRVNPSINVIVENNVILGGVYGVEVLDSGDVWVRGNTIVNSSKGVYGNNAEDIKVSGNTVVGSTVAGVQVENSNGTGYDGSGNDVDIWSNIIVSAAGATGIQVDNSAYATIGWHPTNPFANAVTGGNIVLGGALGIVVNGSNNTYVAHNDVIGMTGNGIQVGGGSNNKVLSNDLANIGWDGINFVGSTNGEIKNNTITNVTGASGIAVMGGSDDTVVQGNSVNGVDRLGIYVWNSNGLDILGNTVNDTGREAGWWTSGIHLEGASGTTVSGNTVTNTHNGGDGIHVGGNGNSAAVATSGNVISGNTIYRIAGDGISVDDSAGVVVDNNKLGTNALNVTQGNNNIGGHGIVINNSNNAAITKNRVRETVLNGVFVDPSDDVEIAGNNIAFSGANGIYLLDGVRGYIHHNTVDESGQDGVKVDNNEDVRVYDNNVDDSNDSGIEIWNSENADIRRNDVTDSDGNGIELGDSDWADIRDNDVEDSGDNGIRVYSSDDTDAVRNDIVGADNDGIRFSNSDNAVIGDNDVTGAGRDGIHLNGGEDGHIYGNTVYGKDGGFFVSGQDGADRDGIHVDNNRRVLIENNLIASGNAGFFSIGGAGAGRDGIHVEDSNRAQILGNTLEGGTPFFFFGGNSVGDNGIVLVRSERSVIDGNDLEETGGNGIVVRESEETEITGNTLSDIGNHGIRVLGSGDSLVAGNTLSDIGGRGIDLGPASGGYSDDTQVENNILTNIGSDGIHIFDTYGVGIRGNLIAFTGGHGVYVDEGSGTEIENNLIVFFGGDGVRVDEDFGTVEIKGNMIGLGLGDAINVSDADEVEIHDNLVGLVGGDGIDVSDSGRVDIRRNTIDFTGDNGIEVSDSKRVRIVNNDIGLNGAIGGNGIDAQDNNRLRIARNTIEGVDENGVFLAGNDRVRLLSNLISNAGQRGLYAAGQDNGYVYLANNTFDNNPVGAEFESGEIDLTGPANTFNGGDIALRFDPNIQGNPLKLTLTGNTIGETIFNGQTQYYIELANGAFFAPGSPTVLNGLDATYDGFRPSTVGGILTQAQFDAIEAKIFHYRDATTLGLFFFGLVPGLNDDDTYNNFSGPNWASGRFQMTITGLPNLPGSGDGNGGGGQGGFLGNVADFLANLAPAAGGDGNSGKKKGQNQSDPMQIAGDLADLEPAASGDEDPACWSQAVSQASSGVTVNYSFGVTAEEALSQAAACGGSI